MTNRAYGYIEIRIRSGFYPENSRLPRMTVLASMIYVSPTTVRRAIFQLAARGYVSFDSFNQLIVNSSENWPKGEDVRQSYQALFDAGEKAPLLIDFVTTISGVENLKEYAKQNFQHKYGAQTSQHARLLKIYFPNDPENPLWKVD